MKLSHKLFASYLLVVAVGLVVLALSTAFVAPITFEQQMAHMGAGAGQGQQRGMMQAQMTDQINAEIEANFRSAVNQALLLAGAAAIIAAGAVSWLVSRQIVNPLRALVSLSQRIASGHYRERLEVQSRDELAELVRSFNQMAEALDHTETIRSELMANMTHELKTPLASIKGYMEGLQDGVIPPSEETFQLVHHEAERLQRLVQDLQELSRAEAGQVPIHPQPSDPCRIVESAIERMRPQFNEKSVELGVKMERSLPDLSADPDRIGQVLINLLGNALQNTAAGGRVEVSLSPTGRMLEFSIQDSGIGIGAENLERIFQRFYRVDKSRSRSSGGSGIGLTISRHLVEAHGGRIWAESPGLGKGSTFRFTIPIV
ncbi:MAG: HAMP domain-containing histidine kinase [Anaerolineae bacterium]|nr:HAMP domain-containing histidine kinase [Anaerolineae bacterium]